jgi:two-component system NtrC family sensor kinase
MRFGLRWQILASLVLIMITTVLLVSLATIGLTARTMEAQERRTAERLARIAVTTMGSAIHLEHPLSEGFNQQNLERLCELFSGQFEGMRVAVMSSATVDSRAVVVASYPPGEVNLSNEIEVLVARSSGRLISRIGTDNAVRQVDVYAPIRLEERTIAVLRLQYPLAEVGRTVAASQQMILVYVILDAVFIVVLGLLILTRLIVRPVQAISAATERVADGDLGMTLAVRSRNELGDLARNFEGMVRRLRENRDVLRDQLSDLAAANAALERTQDELVRSEKLATVGGLAAGIAHEIGNPLAAVIGLLEFVQDRDSLDASDVDDLLSRIDREIERISAIINELLDYARVRNDAVEFVSVRAPLESAIGLCGHHPKTRGLSVTLETEGDAVVLASENRLIQVFLNLLINAGDACDGAGSVRIEFVESEAAGTPGVEVKVQDSGPGIPADILTSIFEPFFTTKGAGEGTGLGLAMSQRIVEQMRGEIWAENPDGGGASFHVWIPSAESGGDAG